MTKIGHVVLQVSEILESSEHGLRAVNTLVVSEDFLCESFDQFFFIATEFYIANKKTMKRFHMFQIIFKVFRLEVTEKTLAGVEEGSIFDFDNNLLLFDLRVSSVLFVLLGKSVLL